MSEAASRIPRTHSVNRAIDVLVAVAESDRAVSASALARTTHQPRPTVSRTLRTLLDRGLVMETQAGWIAGYELYRLARLADPFSAVVEAARQSLETLRDRTGESAILAIATTPTTMEIVAQVDAVHHLGVVGWVGAEVPLHVSAAGKLLLAELSPAELDAWIAAAQPSALTTRTLVSRSALEAHIGRVRRRGWAEIVDELEPGLVSLAAPVRDRAGALIAMVGISGPSTRLTVSRRKMILPDLLESATRIEHVVDPQHALPS